VHVALPAFKIWNERLPRVRHKRDLNLSSRASSTEPRHPQRTSELDLAKQTEKRVEKCNCQQAVEDRMSPHCVLKLQLNAADKQKCRKETFWVFSGHVFTNLLDSLAERNGHDLSGEALECNRDRNRSRILVIETRRELGGLPGYLLLEVNQALQSG
jgi:hypothetical protein